MESASKASGIRDGKFPYGNFSVAYIEILQDGSMRSGRPTRDDLLRAHRGESKIYVMCPDRFSSAFFELDEFDRCAVELGHDQLSERTHKHEVIWHESDYDDNRGQSVSVMVKFLCGCQFDKIKVMAVELKVTLGWEVRVSTGWGGHSGQYYLNVARNGLWNSREFRSKDALVSN